MRRIVGRSVTNRLFCAGAFACAFACALLIATLALMLLATRPSQAGSPSAPDGVGGPRPYPAVAGLASTSTLPVWVQSLPEGYSGLLDGPGVPGSATQNGLIITKSADSAEADPDIVINGETITYTLTFTNSSSLEVTDVLILDVLPEGSLSDVGCSDNCTWVFDSQEIPDPFGNTIVVSVTRQVSWILNSMVPGEVQIRQFWGKVIGRTDGTELLNRAYVNYVQDGVVRSAVSNDTHTTVRVRIDEKGQASLSDTPNWLSEDLGGTLSLDWGDYDGDGWLDLALGSTIGTSVYRNQEGRLVPFWSNNRLTYGVAWGDFDGDGWLDLAAVGESADGTAVTSGTNYLYDLSGETVEEYEFVSNEQLVRLAPGDYNRDGLLDLVVSTNSINAPCPVKLYWNGGNPTAPFASAPVCVNTEATAALGPMDYDSDGDLDLVVGMFPNETHLLINQLITTTPEGGRGYSGRGYSPSGRVLSEPTRSVGYTSPLTNAAMIVIDKQAPFLPYDFSWGDYDGDGLLDLAAAFPLDRRVRIYRNTTDGVLRPGPVVPTTMFRTPLAVAWGDMNGDGTLDLAVADAPPRVYEYKNGKFVEIPALRAEGASGQMWGLGLADVDNEGDVDLALTNRDGSSMLFSNFAPLLAPTLSPIVASGSTAAASVAWADVDGDEDLDLLLGASQTAVGAKRYLNVLGRFPEANMTTLLASGFGPHAVAFGDVNGDGNLDIALGVGLETGVQLYLAGNTDTPDWTSAAPHYASYSVAWGDADDDGDLDLLVGRNGPNAIYFNRGTQLDTKPGWVPASDYDTRSVAWGDFNNDRYLDFAVGNNGGPTEVYRNNHDGTFYRVWASTYVSSTRSVAWGDVDGDGDLDLAVGNYGQPNLIYANVGGRFGQAEVWRSPRSNTRSLAWGDWDNDGDLDLAVGNDGEPDQVYENLNSKPGAAPRLYLLWASSESNQTGGVAWGDVDGDGDLDLAVSGRANGQSGVYINSYVRPSHLTRDFAPTMPLPNNPSYLSIERPGSTDAAFGYSSAELLSGPKHPTVTVSYELFDPDGTRIDGTASNEPGDLVLATFYDYSLNGGATWQAATRMGSGTVPTTTLRLGRAATFDWDAVADEAISDNARFRVCAVQQNQIDVGRNPQHGLICAVSPPFRVRGTTCVWPRGAAILVSDLHPDPGEAVRFQGMVAEGSGVLTYTWDFGDGSSDQGQVVYHTYDTNNYATVKLTVRSEPCPIAKEVYATLKLPVGTGVPDIFLPFISKGWTPMLTTTLPVSLSVVPVAAPFSLQEERRDGPPESGPPVGRPPEGGSQGEGPAWPDSPAAVPAWPDSPAAVPVSASWAGTGVARMAATAVITPGPGISLAMGLDVGQLPLTEGTRGVNSNPSLSDDGMRVAFWSTDDLAPTPTRNNADGNIEIFVADIGLDAAGDQIYTLTQVTESTGNILGGFNLSPALSDDGTRVAFFSDCNLVGGNGGGVDNRDANFEILLAAEPEWTPVQLTETSVGANVLPSINDDGTRIAFASDRDLVKPGNVDGNQEIFYYDAAAGFVQVSRTTGGVLNSDPVISADGEHIAFISDGALRVFDVAAGTVRPVDSPSGSKRQPAISADGRSIAFISDGDVWLVELGAGGAVTPTQITASPEALLDEPEISADGNRVAFVADGQVYFFDKGRKRLSPINGVVNARHPSLSGDGTVMAYVSNRALFLTTSPRADLGVTKISEPYPLVPGAGLIYTVEVHNYGPSSVFTATVVDRIPEEVNDPVWSCVALEPSTCGAGGSGYLISDTIDIWKGATILYTITGWVDPDFLDEVVNTVVVTAPEGLIDFDPGNNRVTDTNSASPEADLWVTKMVDDETPNEGEPIVYTVVVGNRGPSDARGTTLTDALPPGITYTGHDDPGTTTYDPVTGVWTIGRVAVGASYTLRIFADVDVGAAGAITNTAHDLQSLAADPDLSDNSAGAPIMVNQRPRADDDPVTLLEDEALEIDVLANDTDLDGSLVTSTLQITGTGPAHGDVWVNWVPVTPTIVYLPDGDWHGVDLFEYAICDDDDACSTATVSATVEAVNDPPTFTGGFDPEVNEDAGLQTEIGWATAISVGAPYEGGQALTFVLTPSNASLFAVQPAVSVTGTLTYSSAADAFGTALVTVTLHDSGGTANGGDDTSDPYTFTITINSVNDAPTLDPIAAREILEEAPQQEVELSGITAGPGGEVQNLEVTAASSSPGLIPHPTVVYTSPNPTGTLFFSPTKDMTGTATIAVIVTDDGGTANGGQDTYTQTFIITVLNVNDPPTLDAIDDQSIDEDPGAWQEVTLANITAGPGESEPVTVTATSTNTGLIPTAHLVVDYTNPDLTGTLFFSPTKDMTGTATIAVNVSDGLSETVRSFTVTVDDVNDPPTIDPIPDVYMDEDQAEQVVGLAGITAGPGESQTLTVTVALTSGPPGLIDLDWHYASPEPTGVLTITLNNDQFGTAGIAVTVSDGSLQTAVTFTLVVSPVNDPPVAVDDAYATDEDTALLVLADTGVLSNDLDVELDTLTVTTYTQPAQGSVTLLPTGAFTYTPTHNYNGSDIFFYVVSDGNGGTDTGTVTITVNAVNDAPVAVNDGYATDEDTPLLVISATGVLANDSDVDGDDLTVITHTQPASGTVTLLATGAFTYTPAADWNGIVTFTYVVSDGALTDTGMVSITVNPVNDPPVAVDDDYGTMTDTPLRIVAPGVLDNDVDVDLDVLTVTTYTQPTTGTVVLLSTGAFTYTPGAGWSGTDTFLYVVSDGVLTDTAMVAITVTGPPVAVDDDYTTEEDWPCIEEAPGVLFNDNDPEDDPLSVASNTSPAHGSVVLLATGAFTYTPEANWNGTDTFLYVVSDGVLTDTGAVTITVTAVNDPPTATNDLYFTDEGEVLTVVSATGVLSNDVDVELSDLTVDSYTQPAHGSLDLWPDGAFTYTPTARWSGLDTFTYVASDGVLTDTATVTITVNGRPVARDNQYSITNNTTRNIPAWAVLGNDMDPDGDPLTVISNTQPAHALNSVTLAGNGSFTYQSGTWNGVDTFRYAVSDGALTATATIRIRVGGTNTAPSAVNDTYRTATNTPRSVAAPGVLANDTDAEGDTPYVSAVTNDVDHGTLTWAADGSFLYTPNTGWTGSDSFTYRISDGRQTDTATVTIVVGPANGPPVANDDAYPTDEDTPLTVAAAGVLANDTDPDGETRFVAAYWRPAHGTLALALNGGLTYTPDAEWSGTDSFTYRASDGTLSDSATVVITVMAVNDAPTAVDDAATVDEGDTETVLDSGQTSLLYNDSDVEGDTLALSTTPAVAPTHGSVTLDASGTFSYTHDGSETTADSFVYEVCDDGTPSECATATVSITVIPVNDAPVAVDDSYTTDEDEDLTVPTATGVLSNDIDVEFDALSVTTYTQPAHGSVTLLSTGAFTYTPAANWNGTDTFTYVVSDGALTDTGTVVITVTAVNDAPTFTGGA
ncbi:MAG: tandem-95 repeat protein, partial [Anaerolineae bacterium]|nr:tandem-95 repeat protein [Anaerolineae bacterium]